MVFGNDQYVRDWIAHQLGQVGFAGNAMNAFGIAENGQLLGGAALHNYYPDEGVIEVSCASVDPRWLTGKMIRTTFNYAFDLVGCQLAVVRISANNTQMLDIAARLGFTSYTIPRLRGRNEAEMIATLTDDEWRSSRFYRRH